MPDNRLISDIYLVRMLSGRESKNAFAQLYDRYSGKCIAFIVMLLGDETQAKDITHDIFVKIWLRRDLISKVDSFSSYLFRMAKNAVLNHLEDEAINQRYLEHCSVVQEEFRYAVDESVSANELYMQIMAALAKMPVRRREVFVLSRFKGISNQDIAKLLDINLRTVETHISNALDDIRSFLVSPV